MATLALFAFLQETSHSAETSAAAGSTVKEPWLVEQANHIFGPAVLGIERLIMPKIYGLLGAQWHEPPASEVIPAHVVMVILAFGVCILGAYALRGRLSVERPSNRQQLLEVVVEQIRGLLDQVVGPYGRRYVPVIGAFAVFILISNLMGLIPILEAPTVSINVTGALGITSFLYYISMGFRQQGLKYLKHFTGGLTGALLPIGILIFFVEIISNSVRPVTLSIRLFVNMYADHQVGAAFLNLAPWIVPIFTIVLAVFVSFVQTFIFIMLSMVYLSETVPHDENHEDKSAHGSEAAEVAAN